MDVTIIAEITNDGLHSATAQLVAAATSLGANPVVLCPGGVGASDAAEMNGVARVISVIGDQFATFDGGAWAAALDAAAGDGVIFAAATANGREIAARLASKRRIPIIQDATGLESGLTITRPIYSGKAVETSTCEGACVVTIRVNAFEPAPSDGSAEISTVNHSADVSVAIKEAIQKATERLDVAEADIIVSGGRGLGSIENFSKLEAVADQIGAAVGASRAIVDEWGLPHSIQVGQTGKTVVPQLYFAVGISGAIQHLAGMRSSKYIVAINKDPDAPIFSVADYGIVAKWEDALPVLSAELAKLQ
jgi:electron transfer flavoprotein alpha subunit